MLKNYNYIFLKNTKLFYQNYIRMYVTQMVNKSVEDSLCIIVFYLLENYFVVLSRKINDRVQESQTMLYSP